MLLKARKTKKETPNWDTMAKRLVFQKKPSPEYNILIDERSTHNVLYDRLSRIMKGNMIVTSEELENIFIEVIDHIYKVLSLIALNDT